MGKSFFLIGSILLLVIVGAEVLLFTKVVDPPWNPFRPTPEQVLFGAFQNIQDVDTYQSNQQTTITVLSDDGDLKLTIISNASGDQTDPGNLRAEGSFDIDFTASSYGENIALSLKADLRAIGDVAYLRVTEMDLPPEFGFLFALVGIDPTLFENQWIRIDSRELIESSGQDYEEQLELQKKLQEELRMTLLSEELYTIQEELSDEAIGDKAAYHYTVTIHLEKMFDAIMDIVFEAAQEQYAKEYAEDSGFSSDIMMGAAKGAALEFVKKIGDIDFEIWIDKKELLPLSVKIEKSLDLSVFDNTLEGFVTFSSQTGLSGYNDPVTVEVPPDSKSIQELLPEELLGAIAPYSLTPSPNQFVSAQNARIITNMSMYRSMAEISYAGDGSYINVGNSLQGLYSEEYENTKQDILGQGGTSFLSVVSPDGSNYCAKVKLVDSIYEETPGSW